MTISKYTKHYYASTTLSTSASTGLSTSIGSERVASALGSIKSLGLLCEIYGADAALIAEMNDKVEDAAEVMQTIYDTFEKDRLLPTPFLYKYVYQRCDFTHYQDMYHPYWYHPDHLGSSSYITNLDGVITQHMEYLPFGETLVEEHLNSYNSPFKFNAKEFDAETGSYYYGARYYNPKWNIMLSIDQMYDLYPSFSPYAYTLQNPVRYTDPTGMTAEESSPPNEYEVRIRNGEVTSVKQVGDKGGDKTDYITVFNDDISPVMRDHKEEIEVDLVNTENNNSIAESSLFVLGAVANYSRYTEYSKFLNIWRGANGKIYQGLSGRGPNQYTGARGAAQGRAGRIGAGGAFLGGLSMAAYEYEYARSLEVDYGPNMRRHLDRRRTLDQSANATGFLGIIGAAASFGYNLGHLIESVCNCNIQYNPYTRDFTPIEQTLMMYDRLGIDLNRE